MEDERLPDFVDLAHELLVWHYRLGHTPFKRIRATMAKAGDLPKRLATSIYQSSPSRFFQVYNTYPPQNRSLRRLLA